MYPKYKLQVFSFVQNKWIDHSNNSFGWSNKPHHYDTLRKEFDRLVKDAYDIKANKIGYRIIRDDNTIIDVWENIK